MLKRFLKICSLLLALIMFSSLLSGCLIKIRMPDETFVQKKLTKNYDSICVITNFLANSEYNHIYIREADGTMLADLQERQIDNNEVLIAVRRLLNGGKYIYIYKSGNTIHLLQWLSIKDRGCGIAYTISQEGLPEVNYATEFIPLSEPGWFYYVYDYNEWRNQKSKE